VLAGDQRVPFAVARADSDGDDQAAHGHRAGQGGDVLGVEFAHVAADLDAVERDLLRATRSSGSGHGRSSFMRLVAPPQCHCGEASPVDEFCAAGGRLVGELDVSGWCG
jgi:hypothetical protein